MPDVSIITSLYKTERFLPRWAAHARRIAAGVHDAGVRLEFVIIPNDASPTERAVLERLRGDIESADSADLQIHYVPRETLYASWNRGATAATGKLIGNWNVDDVRTVDGIVEGVRLHQEAGYEIIDFPVEWQITHSRLFDRTQIETKIVPPQYDPSALHPHNVTAPFFMYTPELYAKAGKFDEGFSIVGDFEWCMRDVVRQAKNGYGTHIAGQFFMHGDNLTARSSGITPQIEYNVVYLRRGLYDHLRPVNPDVMKQAWERWGKRDNDIPDDVKMWLWGDGAQERYARWQWERSLPQPLRRAFLALAKRGFVHSVDWELHHARQ